MAGEWIKWVKGLTRRREIVAVAVKLGKDRRFIACLFMEMMEWADGETEDGHIAGATPGFVDDLVTLRGFFDAFEEQGWFRATAQGITILNWERHNGDSAKRRAKNALSQHRRRTSVTKTSSPNDDALSLSFSGLPPVLDTPEFRKVWAEYVEHRKGIGAKALQPASVVAKWSELAPFGVTVAVAAVRGSIANGWQGIFPEKYTGGKAPPKPVAVVDPAVAERRAKARRWLRNNSDGERAAIDAFRTEHPACNLDEGQLRAYPVFQDFVAEFMRPREGNPTP